MRVNRGAAGFIVDDVIARDHHEVMVSLANCRIYFGEVVAIDKVVGVAERDPLMLCGLEPDIAGRGWSAILLSEVVNVIGEPALPGSDDTGRTVRRPVVDRNDLYVALEVERLLDKRPEELIQILLDVEDRGNNREAFGRQGAGFLSAARRNEVI